MRLNLCAIEQKSRAAHILSLSLTECLHEFLQFRASFDFEENFIVSVRNLDIQMLGTTSGCGHVGIAVWRLLAGIRHDGCYGKRIEGEKVSRLFASTECWS